MCLSRLWSGAVRLERLIWLKYYFVLKRQNTFSLGLNAAKNTHQKKASNKSSLELNFVQKKQRAYMPISPGVELGDQKINMVEILYYTEMAKYIQFRAQHCQKYASHQKKDQIKVIWNWTSYKNVCERISLCPPPQSGARRLERLIWLKYYIVLKRKNTFNLGLNTDKNADSKRKGSNKNYSEFNFLQKKSVGAYLSPLGVELRDSEYVFK